MDLKPVKLIKCRDCSMGIITNPLSDRIWCPLHNEERIKTIPRPCAIGNDHRKETK